MTFEEFQKTFTKDKVKEIQKNNMCPVCGKHVFKEGLGSYEICPVCGWEDDLLQVLEPEEGGANRFSLINARKLYNAGYTLWVDDDTLTKLIDNGIFA